MVDLSLFEGPWVHLSVDFQGKYLRRLPIGRRMEFEQDMATFRDVAPPDTSHLWIGFGKHFQSFPSNVSTSQEWVDRRLILRELGLPNMVRETDGLFVKSDVNGFYAIPGRRSWLALHLEEHHPESKTLVISGVNTGKCVAHTVAGALANGYRCIALKDLLGDSEHGFGNAEWNAEYLKLRVLAALPAYYPDQASLIDKIDDYLICMTSTDFVALAKEKPAPPVTATPVLKLERRFG
ncbi:MAG TPA: isochorismatase family protein [Alphaproteobacteria bacterium]|nr:isochorismatase family protein [Alphaproteobacteria bacterium]